MDQVIELSRKFIKYVLSKNDGKLRVLFPRKEAILFASEIIEFIGKVSKSYKGDEVIKFSRCEHLSNALLPLAESCKGEDGLESFAEVLAIVVELFVEMRGKSDKFDTAVNELNALPYTRQLLALEESSASKSSEASVCGRKGSDLQCMNPLIEKMSNVNIGNHVLQNRLYILRKLVCNNDLRYIHSIRVKGEGVELFHSTRVSVENDIRKEIETVKAFLCGFSVECGPYVEPRPL